MSGKAQISINSGGTAVVQDFNTLATSGTSNVLPAGWALYETGTGSNPDTEYRAGTGSNNVGDTYSFGAASNTDRAFGGLRSGNVVPTIGASFSNNTGRTITELSIRYQGETWRVGGTNRADQLDFQYSLTATSLDAATGYVDFNVLDYVNSAQSTTGSGTTLPVQTTQVSGTITQLSIPAGATFWIRWTDLDVAGSDDGMGIDDFSLTATTSGAPAPTATLTPGVAALSGFYTTQGTASAQQQFVLTGQNLNGTSVTLTAPTNYELSLTSGTGFTTVPLVLSAYAGASTTVYVRLSGTGLGTQGTTSAPANLTIAGGGAATATVGLSGTVAAAPIQTPTEPTVQAAVVVNSATSTTADITLSGGNGQKRLLVLRLSTSAVLTPADNTTYTASLNVGSGNQVGTSYIMVADGTTTTTTLTGLTAGRAYVLEVYAYNDNGQAGQENYLTLNPGNYAFNTAAAPTAYWAKPTGDLNLLSTFGSNTDGTGTAPPNFTANGRTYNVTGTNRTLSADWTIGGSTSRVIFRSGSSFTLPTAYNLIGRIELEDQAYLTVLNASPAFTLVAADAGSTVDFAQASGTTSSAPAGTYGNLLVSNGTALLNAGTTTISGTLTLSNGTLDIGAGQMLTLNGPVGGSAGRLAGSTTSSLMVGGSGPLGAVRFLSGAAQLQNLTLNRPSANLVLGSDLSVNGTLTLTDGLVTTTAVNLLTLGNGATATGTATGFVSGPLARQASSAGALLFPLGKGTAYRPLTLNISAQAGGTVTYTAEQNEGRPTDQGLISPLARVSRVRSFRLTPSPVPAAGQFAGTVTLSFGADDQVMDPALASFVVGKSNGSGWENIGHSAQTGTAGGGSYVAGTLTSARFTSFSDFALASTDPNQGQNPLPVVLLDFAAGRHGEDVQLRWATASEQHSAHFDVQRSSDGRVFEVLTTVAAQGTSTRRHEYAALDKDPLLTLAYYRLRQVDLDGTTTYSPIVAVAPPLEMALYPNPARTELYLRTAAPGAQYRVLGLLGNVVLQGEAPNGTAVLDIGALPAGVYQLEVVSASGHQRRKFLKQD